MNGSIRFPDSWKHLLEGEFDKPYFMELTERVRGEYLSHNVFPHPRDVFKAFELTAPSEVKVVILGQDPYHTPGVAHGLAFSTKDGNPVPPSLQNIFKEIAAEYSSPISKNPNLTRWAAQGVLLLNASLSVRSGEANSHAQYGWHAFTDAIIQKVSDTQSAIVFMLWGSFAGKKEEFIDSAKHLILKSAHPSPLSAHRGFLGNGHFKSANAFLSLRGRGEIDWS